MLALQLCDQASLVGGRLVQQHDERAGQVAQQLAQEPADLVLADVVEEQQIVEAQAVPVRTERNSPDDGDFVPPPLTMAMDGSLPVPLENYDLCERMGLILFRNSLSRCSFVPRSLLLYPRPFVHALPLSLRTWLCVTKSACCSVPRSAPS